MDCVLWKGDHNLHIGPYDVCVRDNKSQLFVLQLNGTMDIVRVNCNARPSHNSIEMVWESP